MVFGPWGTIWDPLSAAAPWAICQYNWSRTLAPSKFDYFNPKALFSLFSQIPGVNKTHGLNPTKSRSTNKFSVIILLSISFQAKDSVSQSTTHYFPDMHCYCQLQTVLKVWCFAGLQENKQKKVRGGVGARPLPSNANKFFPTIRIQILESQVQGREKSHIKTWIVSLLARICLQTKFMYTIKMAT